MNIIKDEELRRNQSVLFLLEEVQNGLKEKIFVNIKYLIKNIEKTIY